MFKIKVPQVKKHSTNSRRRFIRNTSLVAGWISIIPHHVLGRGFSALSDKIKLGSIGRGKQQIDNKSLLANLYDKIYELLTTEGTGFNPSKIRVQMVQGKALNLKDYANALSGSNPSGDISAAEAVSTFVDKVPELSGTLWAHQNGLAKFYQGIVSGSNVDPNFLPSERQEALYNKLQGFLRAQVEHTSVVTGKKTYTIGESPIYASYQEAKTTYINALLGDKQVVLDTDLSTYAGKRQALLDKRRSDNKVMTARQDWIRTGKSEVDQVLDALESIKNDAPTAIISDAKELLEQAKWLASGAENEQPWMLSSVTPSNWTEPTSNATTLTISSDKLKASNSETAETYSENAKGWFWYGSSSSSGSIVTKNVDMAAESFKLSGELVLVRIQRPWLNQLLFTIDGWFNNAYSTDNPISDGKGGGALPGIPIAFIMMRNVSIEAKFNQADSDYIHTLNNSSSRSGWGWGPFGGSIRASNSESKTDNFESSGDGIKLSFDQPQVLAWISTVLPKCPPAKK